MSAAEENAQVLAEMGDLMRCLRKCDTQADAIVWMTDAYNAMDKATHLIQKLERMVREEAAEKRGLIFQIPRPKLEVVQSIEVASVYRPIEAKKANYTRPSGETVVYPDFFLHPGLKPVPKPWTREDTRKLEAASKMGPRRFVHKNK